MSGRSSPRLAPLPRAEWDDAVRAALRTGFSDDVAARFFATGDDAVAVPNVLGTLVRHPDLAGSFLAYNGVLLRRGVLDARVRELAVLRVAWRTRAAYEWAQHVRMATKAGLTASEIEAIADGAATEWSPLEAAVLAAVVELVFVVGTYTGLAMAFNSFGLELDADLASAVLPSGFDGVEEG